MGGMDVQTVGRRNAESVDASLRRSFGETHMDGKWLVETLVPGFIEAHAGMQFGAPCLIGTRVPAYVAHGWVWEELGDPYHHEDMSDIEIVALAAFEAGVQWQRSRVRRKRMEAAVAAGWKSEPAR